MRVLLREFEINQSPTLAALLLRKFYEASDSARPDGLAIPYAMPVLPLLFNRKATNLIHNKNFTAGLLRVLREDRSVAVGLQHRMVEMSDLTFGALNIGLSSGLLAYDAATACVKLGPGRMPTVDEPILADQMAAARRLGSWFAELSLAELCILLDISF